MSELFDIETAYVDVNAIDNGKWVPLGADFPGVEIHARGFSSKDAQEYYNLLRRRIPKNERMSNGAIPEDVNERIMKSVIVDKCLTDWRGLASSGKPLAFSKETARTLLNEPRARKIALAFINAIVSIDETIAGVDEDAEKN